jgi:hypothetical protein
MAHQHPLFKPIPFTYPAFASVELRTADSYERELTEHRGTEIRLLEALASARAVLRQKEELIGDHASRDLCHARARGQAADPERRG